MDLHSRGAATWSAEFIGSGKRPWRAPRNAVDDLNPETIRKSRSPGVAFQQAAEPLVADDAPLREGQDRRLGQADVRRPVAQ